MKANNGTRAAVKQETNNVTSLVGWWLSYEGDFEMLTYGRIAAQVDDDLFLVEMFDNYADGFRRTGTGLKPMSKNLMALDGTVLLFSSEHELRGRHSCKTWETPKKGDH